MLLYLSMCMEGREGRREGNCAISDVPTSLCVLPRGHSEGSRLQLARHSLGWEAAPGHCCVPYQGKKMCRGKCQ